MSDQVAGRLGLVDASIADMARQLSNHGPSGDAWPEEADSVYQQELLALAPTFARLNDRANYLVTDMFPGTSLELLPEWERSVGLPDPCSGPDPTIALRQLHVLARLTYRGGQSVPYFTGYAAALGYAITITEFAPACADLLLADGPVYDPSWAHVWQVNAPSITVQYFSADASYADEPLATFGNTALVCELSRIAPAHTILLFAFGSAGPISGGTTPPITPPGIVPAGALTDSGGAGLTDSSGTYLTAS